MSTIIRNRRDLIIDIYDYAGNEVCPLYDSRLNIEGQASDVVITTERNGWKELSFTLPGNDFRTQYLIADYKLKIIENDGELPYDECDWFLITKPSVKHVGYSKNISVTAGHISQLLKTKNLTLEFSDKEGNNVGTARQLLTTILEGTGWNVGNVSDFYEDKLDSSGNKVIKIRSLTASTKTGAFKLISNLCELFEAKPLYHGYNKTVDLKPLNPFAKLTDSQIIEQVDPDNVLELHYGKNVKTMTRTYNAENLVTKLYAYGAYGKAADEGGYCGIDECTHTEYRFKLNEGTELEEGTKYYFSIYDASGTKIYRNFIPTCDISGGHNLLYSDLDKASMMYVYDEDHEVDNDGAFFLDEGIKNGVCIFDEDDTSSSLCEFSKEDKTNYYSFLMDFSYYSSNGLFTQEMLQKLAQFQNEGYEKLKIINEKSTAFSSDYKELTDTIGTIDYVKLNVTNVSALSGDENAHIVLTLSNPDKVIYRTDYYNKESDYFKWRKANEIKANGDPTNEEASVIYMIEHKTDESTGIDSATGLYNKYYIKAFDNEEDPYILTLFGQYNFGIDYSNYDFYLFKANAVTGLLGGYEAFDEAAVLELDSATTSVTVKHPVIFSKTEPEFRKYDPQIDFPTPVWIMGYNAQYAWWWKYYDGYDSYPSELYFCYYSDGDEDWYRVHVRDVEPPSDVVPADGEYYYNIKKAKLYRRSEGSWKYLDKDDDVRVTLYFSTVFMYGQKRDMYYKGLYQKYITSADGSSSLYVELTEKPSDFDTDYKKYYKKNSEGIYVPVSVGETFEGGTYYKFIGFVPNNYYMPDPYGNYWCFTSNENASSFTYDTTEGFVTQHLEGSSQIDSTVDVKTINFTSVKYHPENIFESTTYEEGTINDDGGDEEDTTYFRTEFCAMYPNLPYTFYGKAGTYIVHFYTNRHTHLDYSSTKSYLEITLDSDTDSYELKSINNSRFVRVTSENDLENSSIKMNTQKYETAIIIGEYNETYYLAEGIESVDGQRKGIVDFIKKFWTYSDKTYLDDYAEMKEAQDAYTEYENEFKEIVGDMYREGYWQKNDYVNGDEDKLYSDALDNLSQISKPEVTYNVDYLDLTCAKTEALEEGSIKWPDFDTDVAIHAVDPEIKINCWAYVDKLSKCYDDPSNTKLSINTNLTTCAQHSFTDVLTNIANVASEVKGKVTMYDRSSVITSEGTIPSTVIEGSINTDTTSLSGCSSTWYTDSSGNMVFESADGQSAMTITGSGFSISNSKDKYGDWIWTTFGNGNGFNANVITAGFMSADRIQANSITAEQIAADTITAEELKANCITATEIAADAVTARAIAAESVDAERIKAGSITVDRVDGGFGTQLNLAQNSAVVSANNRIAFIVQPKSSDPTQFELTDNGMKFIGDNIENHLTGTMKTVIEGSNTWLDYGKDGLSLYNQDDENFRFASRMANDGFYIHDRDGNMEAPIAQTDIVGKFIATGLETKGVKIGDIVVQKTSQGGWVWR